MPELPTQEEVQAEFDVASEEGLSPCAWIPPKWELLQIDEQTGQHHFRDNTSQDTLFNDPEVIQAWREHLAQCADMSPPEPPGSPYNEHQWPNPFSDFSHDHEYHEIAEELGDDPEDVVRLLETRELREVRAHLPGGLSITKKDYCEAVEELRGNGHGQSSGAAAVAGLLEVTDVKEVITQTFSVSRTAFEETVGLLRRTRPLPDRLMALNKLKVMLGPQSVGMQRLAQVFDWALCRTTELLYDLNTALTEQNETRYGRARTNYLKFLHDLDERDPLRLNQVWKPEHTKDKTARSCYGKALKWACIDPVILGGKIVGTRVVIQWNPHSSSSGVPISHPLGR
jgi:hypothetical protein